MEDLQITAAYPIVPHLDITFLHGTHENVLGANDSLLPAVKELSDLHYVINDLNLTCWSCFQEHLSDCNTMYLESLLPIWSHPNHGILESTR